MRKMRKTLKWYIWLHVALLAILLLFPLYRAIMTRLNGIVTGCFIHDRLFLYCPFCGGTRALDALLHLDFATAWTYNPMVMILGIVLIGLDIWALIRLIKGRNDLLPLPTWIWVTGVGLVIAYGILRNYLMIVHGYDPVGDLGVFWNRLK